jgi:hypothetical protein
VRGREKSGGGERERRSEQEFCNKAPCFILP